MSEKVDFIAVKITQILVNIQKKFLDTVWIFYKNKLCEYLLISHAKSFLRIPPVNILYTNGEINICMVSIP